MDDPKTKAVDAEIVDQNAEAYNQYGWKDVSYRARFGNATNGIWQFSPIDASGCLAPAVSLSLFLICLAQFGVLAGMGFLVFYCIGAIFGSLHAAKKLMLGQRFNPWIWRSINWSISFFLTVWLAGGLNN